ncbi:MAG: hypothetical protein MUF81_01030 [Verrucomicrobia bacterium]|nr:hypothetical protein [Verrucomicrobiota bacterium]
MSGFFFTLVGRVTPCAPWLLKTNGAHGVTRPTHVPISTDNWSNLDVGS